MFFEILHKYGAVKDNRASYDEKVSKLYDKYNIPRIEIKLDFVDSIYEEFIKSDKSLIITGSAGDGKTFILRKIFKKLGGAEFKDGAVASGVTFVLDFTAVENKYEILQKAKKEKYIIAANDGILSDFEIEDDFLIKDLSKTSSAKNFSLLLDKILEYIDKYEEEKDCIIFKNIKTLKEVKSKVEDLIRMCDYNYEHVTMRRLFIFIANMILGSKSKTLYKKCEKEDFLDSNLYSNILGENLTSSARNKRPFEFMQMLSLGYKSSNEIDELILYADLKQNEELLKNHYFGLKEFYAKRDKFLENGDYSLIEEYMKFFRRHLYFKHGFNLIRYISFDEYKELFETLKDGKKVKKSIKKEIALALNRLFLGSFVNERDDLFIGTSFKNSNERVANEIIEKLDVREIDFEFVKGNDDEYGEIYLKIKNAKMLIDLDIYEFFKRIANGSLVNSFSNEFFERVMIFKSQLISEDELILFKVDERGRVELYELELGEDYVSLQ